ncbi:MAG TPA: hypothetical protein VLL48_13705, partial [Longimicrobiales bacterium]|nr:hypothetical protein [Longimicrobiales bacterium]
PRTRALTVLGLLLPRPLRLAAGSSPFVTGLLEKAGSIAVPSCRPADGESHAIEPRRVWSVEASVAVVEGRELGPIRLHARSGAPHPPGAGTGGVDAEPPVPLFVVGRVRSPEGSSVAAEPEEVRRTA